MKKINAITVILIILLGVFAALLGYLIVYVFPNLNIENGWERIIEVEINANPSLLQFDAESEILWVINEFDSLLKISLVNPENFQEATFGPIFVRNMCIGNDAVYIIGGGDISYLIDKDNLEVKNFTEFYDDKPYNCLLDYQRNIIVYDEDWYGIYAQQSWQFFDGFSWEGERLEIQKILSPSENTFFVITADNQLFEYSVISEELLYLGALPVQTNLSFRGSIASGEMLWLSSNNGDYFSWSLPLDVQALTPTIKLYADSNLTRVLGSFIDQDGRTWIIREDNIFIVIGQDDFVSIKKPFQVDELNSVYFDENVNMIYIGTDNGIFRSSVEELLKVNGLSN